MVWALVIEGGRGLAALSGDICNVQETRIREVDGEMEVGDNAAMICE